ncbi:MAG: cysteine desulfurase family protein [Flavobacteriaceae bacterium]|nr:cysteine desulfurase family protein [Flavobacteriaceae bacterium]
MNSANNISYLDYNATIPIDPRVLDAMLPFLKENFGNANSTHHFGSKIKKQIDDVREKAARFIKADTNEIIFTSGATEAINMALKGIADVYHTKGNHMVTVSTEHKAVLDTCKYLEGKGYEITYLSVDKYGLIDLNELEDAIQKNTILVCVMHVNNETGVIQLIGEIASIVRKKGVLFMTDATQSVGKINVDMESLGIDLLCLSGHKMYAPKGIGALYVRKSINLPTYMHGGGNEKNLRSGTLNVPAIVGLGKACEIATSEMKNDAERVVRFRDELETELLKIPKTFVNGNPENRIYNVSNICFKGFDANVMIGRMKNVAVSNGSACTSAVIEPSHVLTSMGLSRDDAFSSLRFSLGKYTTDKDIKGSVKNISEITQSIYRYA